MSWKKADKLTKGTTSSRPSNPDEGFMYFDTDLIKPIWYSELLGSETLQNTDLSADANSNGIADSWNLEQDGYGFTFSVDGGQVISGTVASAGGYCVGYQSIACSPTEKITFQMNPIVTSIGTGSVTIQIKFYGDSGLLQASDVYTFTTSGLKTLPTLIAPSDSTLVQIVYGISNVTADDVVNVKFTGFNLIKRRWVNSSGIVA